LNQEGSILEITQIPVGQMANFSYIISDKNSLDAAVVDPSWDLETIISVLEKNKWNAKYIINTHTHFDHILGNEQMAAETGAKIMQHENSTAYKDIAVKEGHMFTIGDVTVNVLFTPGHSNDSICLIVHEDSILTGDTLFIGNCGRTDLPGSDTELMYESLYNKIRNLKESLIIYPGHDYGPAKTSTIYEEKRSNPMLNFKSKDSFLRYLNSSA
jgi:hydroxyacylglutathione hydrolase